MRYSASIVVALVAVAVLAAQAPMDPKLQNNLKRLFPAATSFSPKGGDPPHFKAFSGQTLLGLAFWTTELQPLERAYDGPIKILVGMKMNGVLAVWSAREDRKFEQRLRHGRFDTQVERVRGRLQKGGPRHTIFLGHKSLGR